MNVIKKLDYLLANEPNVFPNDQLMLAAEDFVKKYNTTGQLNRWDKETADSILNLITRRRDKMATLFSKTMDVSFVIEGYDNMIDVDVTYTYYKGMPATDVEPAEPPTAEIKTITWGGMGIAVLLDAVDPQIIRDLEQRIVDEE